MHHRIQLFRINLYDTSALLSSSIITDATRRSACFPEVGTENRRNVKFEPEKASVILHLRSNSNPNSQFAGILPFHLLDMIVYVYDHLIRT